MNFLASFLISALMGMGVGGGGLFIIYLTLCLDFPQPIARGTNLCFFVIAGVFSLLYHFKKRKIVPWQVGVMVLFGSLGSIIFSNLALSVDPKYPRLALGALLIISGICTLCNIIIIPLIIKIKKTLYK